MLPVTAPVSPSLLHRAGSMCTELCDPCAFPCPAFAQLISSCTLDQPQPILGTSSPLHPTLAHPPDNFRTVQLLPGCVASTSCTSGPYVSAQPWQSQSISGSPSLTHTPSHVHAHPLRTHPWSMQDRDMQDRDVQDRHIQAGDTHLLHTHPGTPGSGTLIPRTPIQGHPFLYFQTKLRVKDTFPGHPS